MKIIKSFIVITLAVLLFGVFLESIFRLFEIGDPGKYQGWGHSDEGFGDYRPNQRFLAQVIPDHPYLVITDKYGFRRASNEEADFKIIAIGDSFTFGPYLNNGDPWPDQLERKLKENNSVAVYNAGVPGYTIQDQYYYLNDKGLSFEPDLIILMAYANDISDFREQKRAQFLREKNPHYMPIINFFRDNSYGFSLVLDLVVNSMKNKEKHANQSSNFDTHENITYFCHGDCMNYWDSYEEYFEKFVVTTKNNSIPLLVVIMPEYRDIKGELNDEFTNGMMLLCEKYQTSCLNLKPELNKYDPDKLYLTPFDTHTSTYGNAIIADYISKKLNPMLFK